MNWLECILYGLISGLTEFLPISSHAHQTIFEIISGTRSIDSYYQLMIHIGCFAAAIYSNRTAFEMLRREQKHPRNRRGYSRTNIMDSHVVKTAAIPMLIGLFVIRLLGGVTENLLIMAIFLLINGVIIYAPERMLQGNKNAGAMSTLDSIFIGGLGALSAIPGISQIGCTSSIAIARGADRQHALRWSLLLSVYALGAFCVLDLFFLFSAGASLTLLGFFLGLLASLSAFVGGYISICLIRFWVVKTGLYGFAFYSWGAALFSFILYLTVI